MPALPAGLGIGFARRTVVATRYSFDSSIRGPKLIPLFAKVFSFASFHGNSSVCSTCREFGCWDVVVVLGLVLRAWWPPAGLEA